LVSRDLLSGSSTSQRGHDRGWFPNDVVSKKILGDSVARGELTISDAKGIARKALFDNSNVLYDLKLKWKPVEGGELFLILCELIVDLIDLNTDLFSAKAVSDILKSKGIDFVRIQWVDYCNLIVHQLICL
jgi:hypothetical protein